MIRINLLPEGAAQPTRATERVIPSEQVSAKTYLIMLAIAAVLGALYYFGIHYRTAWRRIETQGLEAQVDGINKKIQQRQKGMAGLKAREAITKSLLDIVYALDPEDRLLWSEKLNQLSDLIPDTVYLTHLTVIEQVGQKETAGSKRRQQEWADQQKAKTDQAKGKPVRTAKASGAPPKINYPVITQTLEMASIADAESEADRLGLMNEFYSNLMKGQNEKAKIQSDFMRGFNSEIAYGVYARKTVGGRNVSEFSFTLTTKPTGPRFAEEPAAAETSKAGEAAESKGEAKPKGGGGTGKARGAEDVE